jgi:hypothetical protein
MATATRVVGNKKGDGNKEGDGNPQQQHRQWPQQRGWWAFDGGNNGDWDGDGTRDMAACATTGERGIMVAMGHGFCVCFCVSGETTKNKEESKIVSLCSPGVAICRIFGNRARYLCKKLLVWMEAREA